MANCSSVDRQAATLLQLLSRCALTKELPVHRLASPRRPSKAHPRSRSRSLNPPPTTQCPHSRIRKHVPTATRPNPSPPCPRTLIPIQMCGGSHHQIKHHASPPAQALAQDNRQSEHPPPMASRLRPSPNGEGRCQNHSQSRLGLKPRTKRVSFNGRRSAPTASTPPLCLELEILSNNSNTGLLHLQTPLPML